MARPTKKQQIPNLQDAIKETAWKQIAEFGAPALSLRAIARALKITAPAIYNYFPRRDDLVTALLRDAYVDFGDSQLAALEGIPTNDLVGRLMAAGVAYRQWALQYPERYHLIFGATIPRYVAPPELMPIAARSLSALLRVLEALRARGRLKIMSELKVDPRNMEMFEMWKMLGEDMDIQSFSAAILIWARVHGLVSLEIGHNLPSFGPSAEALYQFELDSIRKDFIKRQS